jgi:DNA-binding LacI/PurR family transcriptional regulator/signal transduction histidine kinase
MDAARESKPPRCDIIRASMGARRPRLGFVTASFREPYQMSVWKGSLTAAKERGHALIFASGGRLSSPLRGESTGNIAYSFMTPETVGGVVALSTAIGALVGREEIRAFCASFAPLPLVSVGISVEGVPSVTVDNEAGMRMLVKHLIEVHGYRRFAYISGPSIHQEAVARTEALSETLASHGIRGEPSAVFRGTFTSDGGRQAAERFLSGGLIGAGRSKVDAIIAANDRMAISVSEALEDHSIRVPQDVAVVGIDDIEESAYFTPPLTTVHQPLFELGRGALELLLVRAKGREVGNVILKPELIVRESCGCPPSAKQERGRARIAQRISETRSAIVMRLSSDLMEATDTRQILGAVSSGIRELGIARCYLSLFESGRLPSEYSTLFEILPVTPSPSQAVGRRYRTREILPSDIIDREDSISLMFFPLHFDADPLGFIVYEYTENMTQFQEDVRDSLARAIKMAELIEKVRNHEVELEREVKEKTLELKLEMERRRILEKEVIAISGEVMDRVGQDIHDGLSQKLAALSMLASALESRLSERSLPEASAAHKLVHFLNEAISDAQEIARGLYPAELEKNGLISAVQELVDSVRRYGEIDIGLKVKGKPDREDQPTALQIYRIIQEALGNALKHSRATRIDIVMECNGDSIRVDIFDNGVGIPHNLLNVKGMGLRIMMYRAKTIDAGLEIQSIPGGTRITVEGRLFKPTP